jgi:glucose-6-phosphate 1-epimerase
MEFETRNDAKESLIYEEALYTYFAIGDIHQTSVSGLEDTTYIDKMNGFKRKPLGNQPVRIAKETDLVYLGTKATCVTHDQVWNRRTIVEKSAPTALWSGIRGSTRPRACRTWPLDGVETANAAHNTVHRPPGRVS